MVSKDIAPSLTDRFSNFYQQLSFAASDLNAASDGLSEPINALDQVLKNLNLGISTWVEFDGEEDHHVGTYWQHFIGYSKSGGKWGICIAKESGMLGDGYPNFESWLFSDAPRAMRIEAIEKLPELLEKIIKETQDTTAKIKAKVAQAKSLAETIKPPKRK